MVPLQPEQNPSSTLSLSFSPDRPVSLTVEAIFTPAELVCSRYHIRMNSYQRPVAIISMGLSEQRKYCLLKDYLKQQETPLATVQLVCARMCVSPPPCCQNAP